MTRPKNALDLRIFLLAALGLPAQIGCGTDGGKRRAETAAAADPCETTTALVGGFEECADGAVNRSTVETCPVENAAQTCPSGLGAGYGSECATDADCTDAPNGACVVMDGSDEYCGCAYTCASDADCGEDEICVCEELTPYEWSQCVPAAQCATNDDCGEEGECGLSAYSDGCNTFVAIACRENESDQCHGHDDCGPGWACATTPSGISWSCKETATCTLGRPMYVDGAARLAPLAASMDWSSPLSAEDLQRIPGSSRAALATHWAEIGRGEHASVASFARFSLHLLSLGAPPELLLATQQAAADEVRHAQGAFAIASALAGAPVGPGPMDLADVSLNATPEQILRDLVLEGCVGETAAVVEAISALARERVPAIAAFRQAVVRDESEHAALAWRCLAWMLQQRPELAPVARAAFDEGIASARPQDRDAIERVVNPCAKALLTSTNPSSETIVAADLG